MARMRRSSEQTLEYKIEQAEAKVAKTREAHEKAVDELKKLYDIRKAYQRDELLKAMENSSRSYDEILAFITSEDAPEDEEKQDCVIPLKGRNGKFNQLFGVRFCLQGIYFQKFTYYLNKASKKLVKNY